MPKTGATRYQKFLKSEKAKTKLKAKKDLPKGTNVTKTNFKIKKIVIREQLKTHSENEILTTKKLNVKDLLSRLKHFNSTSRTEGLNGLKEMITRHDIFSENMSQFIHGVTPLVLDIERTVRRETFKLLHLALTSAPAHRMEPFFEVMFSYLRCAMTHIDTGIQEDSLFFLDMLLTCTPTQIAINFQKIIPNFMDMISKLRIDSKPGRTLTVNLGSKLTSVKWRVKVLTRLHEFLRIIVNYKKSVISDSNQRVISKNNLQIYALDKPNYFPLFNPVSLSNCYLSCLSRNNKINSTPINTDEAEKFKSYVETLIPLLFETWVEVGPSEIQAQSKKLETVISEEAASLLKQILHVISLLWQYLQIIQKTNPNTELATWFKGKFKREYNKHLISNFPYVTTVCGSRGNKRLDQNDSTIMPNLVHENLEMCFLYICFNSNINIKQQGLEINKILNYTKRSFTHNMDENNNEKIIRVLGRLFSKESQGWTRNATTMEALFSKLISCYLEKELSPYLHQQIFSLLCTILLDDRLVQFHKMAIFQSWIADLPDILCGNSVTTQTVTALHRFAVQNNSLFNQTFKLKMAHILNNLPNICLINYDNDIHKQKLWSLLYWINGWESESLNILEQQLASNAYGVVGGKYIMEILKIKSEKVAR